jgi:hypothetical protein
VFRCEAEESESGGVKVEESTTYPISSVSNWSADRNGQVSPSSGRRYGTAPLSPGSNSPTGSPFYSSATERWSDPYDTSHSPRSETRTQPWSVSPTQLHPGHLGSGRRNEDASHSDSSWTSSSPPSHSSWPTSEPYGLSTVTDLFVDQARSSRTPNHYHHNSVNSHGRAADESSFGPSNHGAVNSQDVGSHQRLSWMIPTDSPEGDRGGRNPSSRNFGTSGSTATMSQHFSAAGSYAPMSHSFSAAWPSSSASSLESPSSPAFNRPSLTYDTYSSSRTEDGYVSVEEYGEF